MIAEKHGVQGMKFKNLKQKNSINDKFIISEGTCCTDKIKTNSTNISQAFPSILTPSYHKRHKTTYLINNNSANIFSAPTCPVESITNLL